MAKRPSGNRELVMTYYAYPEMQIDSETSYTAVITTNHGSMDFELLPAEAPLAVNSFVFLANDGYFDGQVSHRMIPGFMVQTGDPTGTGFGGPGYSFTIERPKRPYVRGSLAMANSGRPDTNGSQFFIVFADLTARGSLGPDYSIFGQMTEGETTLAMIESVPVGENRTGDSAEVSVPQQPISIKSVTIHEG